LPAHNAGVEPTFLGVAAIGVLNDRRPCCSVVPALQISIDFTKSLTFKSAQPPAHYLAEQVHWYLKVL
jgi:hypothetical protein